MTPGQRRGGLAPRGAVRPRGAGPPARRLRRLRGRRPGGGPRGGAAVAGRRAPRRPARLAGDGRLAATRGRAPECGRPHPARGPRRPAAQAAEPAADAPPADRDDTLLLLVLCCHPALSEASRVALTLRSVGGLTTEQVAAAFLVPTATMAQRISRAKATLRQHGARFEGPRPRSSPSGCRRPPGALPRVQRGVRRHGRRPAHRRVRGGGGDPADPDARARRGRGGSHRRRDHRAAGADAADPRPPRRAHRRPRRPGAARRAGPVPVGRRPGRGGDRPGHRGARAR